MAEIIDGVKIKMGGKEYEVPALSFGQLRRLMPKIESLSSLGATVTAEQMDAIGELVFEALKRNYPDITREAVEDMIDLRNAGAVIAAVMGQSGLVSKGEA